MIFRENETMFIKTYRFKEVCPYIGTNVKFFGGVFLISTLKKGIEIIKEIWGYWACFGVTRF
jgi:hypothetical protein